MDTKKEKKDPKKMGILKCCVKTLSKTKQSLFPICSNVEYYELTVTYYIMPTCIIIVGLVIVAIKIKICLREKNGKLSAVFYSCAACMTNIFHPHAHITEISPNIIIVIVIIILMMPNSNTTPQ